MTYRLGVDLGTTFTAAAVANGSGPSMLGLGNRALQIPSVLFVTDDGDFLVGEAAERRGQSEPDRLVREFKRRIGDHVPILVAGAPYSPEILTARLLRWVVAAVTEQMGEPPTQTMVTHPANWGPYKLEMFAQAVALAEIGPSGHCTEPEAAAARYAARARVAAGGRLAVYDFGGGTFDVCVLEQTAGGFQLLGTPDGVEHLGGVDIDAALFQWVMNQIGAAAADLDLTDPGVRTAVARLRRDVTDAKEALSDDVTATVMVSLPGLSRAVRITRAELEGLIRPALRTTIETFVRTLRSAGLAADDLEAIVLIGGSSRIPLVGELLQVEFGVAVAVDTHPKHDVALGATLLARSGPPPALPKSDGPVEPLPDQPEAGATAAGRRPRPRSSLVLAAVVATVVAGVVAGGVVADRLARGSNLALAPAGGSSAANSSASVAGDPSVAVSTSPTPGVDPSLPRSAALGPTELIVPMSFTKERQFFLFDGDTSKPAAGRQLTRSDDSDRNVIVAPDRRSAIFVRQRRDADARPRQIVKVMAVDGSGSRDLFPRIPSTCTRTVYRPAWNPIDQTLLALPCTSTGGVSSLILIHTDGREVRTIETGAPAAGSWVTNDPSFSPDGTRLTFWAGTSTAGGAIYVTDLTTPTGPKRLTSADPGRDAYPTWTPDGKTIVFQRRVTTDTGAANLDLYRIAADGSQDAEPLLTGPADDQSPSWSPAEDRFAYKSNAPTPDFPGSALIRVWTADPDGGNRRLLWTTGKTSQQGSPSWRSR